MDSISYNRTYAQAPGTASFRYALKTSPQQIQRLSRDELLTLCMEQYFLLWLVIAIIRNPLAAISTRVIVLDLIFSMVEKNVKGKIKEITERTRIYISGDGGAAKRLGIHANTVSKTYKNLETYHMVERDYVFDEATQKEYLDLTLTPLQLHAPEKLQDKTLRTMTKTASNHPAPHNPPPPAALTCPACGSNDVLITCRSCGSLSTPEEEVTISQDHAEQAVTDTPTLLHKICGVDTINAPLNGDVAGMSPRTTEDTDQDAPGETNNGRGDQLVSDVAYLPEASSPPPHGPEEEQKTRVTEDDADQVIISWLSKRIGHGKLIYATGSAEYSKKYYNKPTGYQPDYPAYLAGDKQHILGSYLSFADKTTFVLAFDIDEPEAHARHEQFLADLASAGACPVYWMRAGDRGHLELYFDRPVAADQARAWCLSVCPELEEVGECYPAQDKGNQPIAWPLYQRKGDVVTPCRARAILPHTTQVRSASITNRAGLAKLITAAVTPASLVEAFQMPEKSAAAAAVPGRQAAVFPPPAGEDLAKVVIAEFNRTTTWDAVVANCGGFTRDGKFKAVWRNERSPSVAIDANGQFASDYGRTAGFPRKLDKYEVWCLVQGGLEFKRFDLAARIEAYRQRMQGQGETPLSPPLPSQESTVEIPAAQPILQPDPNETAEEIVARLRQTGQSSRGRVMTPAGAGTLWQIWPSRIGVVLDSDPKHVKFFTDLGEMHRIVAIPNQQGETQ